MVRQISLIIFVLLATVGCRETVVPRPRGFFRIELPEPAYAAYDSVGEPYRFERSALARVVPDKDANSEPHWINVKYDRLNCTIHGTYRPIRNNLDEVLEDSRKLVYKHTVKADAIEETYYEDTENNVYGVLYNVRGNAATPLQFMLTDSCNNAFRGSVYFYCRPNADSLAPVVKYIEDDVAHLIETFRWK